MFKDRLSLYKEIEKSRESKIIVYVTGDRPGMETQIHSEVLDFFVDHLDTLGEVKRISLLLYSRGGDTLAGWSIVNLLRQFCKDLEVLVPSKAQSTATLISLGADKIVMTKQATLGPIDPSINTPLNPQFPGGPLTARVPVSVEAVAAYFDLAKKELGVKGQQNLTPIFLKLSEHVHPLALGSVNRARTQIQMLAERLLSYHKTESSRVKKIISVLCSESGSHDYTVNRIEAEDLGLPIEKPSDSFYKLLRSVHNDFRNELELNNKFDAGVELGAGITKPYSYPRALLESISGGSNKFISEGVLMKQQVTTPTGIVDGINDQRTFEGWRHEKAGS